MEHRSVNVHRARIPVNSVVLRITAVKQCVLTDVKITAHVVLSVGQRMMCQSVDVMNVRKVIAVKPVIVQTAKRVLVLH